MMSLPTRAPIAYEDLRLQYNAVRGLGSLLVLVGVSVFVATGGETELLFIAIPALAIAVDSAIRINRGSSPLVPVMIDATVIGVAMYLRGPAPAIHAVMILSVFVISALLLPFVHAGLVLLYTVIWSIAITAISNFESLPYLGIIDESGVAVTADRITIVAVIAVVVGILFQSVLVILAAQDRQEEALAQERRAVQLKNEFVSMVSHELRTPLTGITGFTETLVESWTNLPPSEVDEFLKIMFHETEHLSNLVEDILVIPRLEAGQLRLHPEDLDLTVEAHGVANVVFNDLDYSVSIPANVIVRADRTRVRQIMRNLLENARKYGGDQVLIEGELASPGLYKVSVSDNGRGIGSEDQERIFKHFEQLSTGDARIQQGVGLGLPIARTLARAMGGDLWYENRFPVGSKFCFTVQISGSDHGDSDADEQPITHAHV
ncbi:MAG: HAMP domain-containing histidine kinase [Actinomycetia bacterium]|nr:HAMP domain-containing histidine kinase [Actinomycetes bacterium]